MDVGIFGLPQSGKTTVFNAVTRGRAEVASYGATPHKPNVGVAHVPDSRLARLAEVYSPGRGVPAQVSYVDVPPGPDDFGNARGIAGELLSHLQRADALLLVARAFEDPSVGPVEDGVDPFRDIETMLLELSFADIEILERRLTRLAEGSKGAKAPERELLTREKDLLDRLRAELEGSASLRNMSLTQDEARHLEGFQLLTRKPLVVVANAGEERIAEVPALEQRMSGEFDGPGVRSAALVGKLEMELVEMEPADEAEFRESMGLGESGLDRMIRLSHEAGDLITFFTGNDNEVRAWTVPTGILALKAAGKVHSDFERGFIRAEVVAYEDLDAGGSIAEARRRGTLRQEGKAYEVKDGDVLNILFNV